MGIYLPNMEMPVTCCHCPLMGYDPDIEWADGGRETQGAYICVITHELIDNTKREDHCPLVPVPPHERLIEKGALLDKCYQHYEDFMYGKIDGKTALLNIEKEIKAAPNIIEAEEGGCSRYDHCRIAQTGTCQYAEEEKMKESLCLNCQSKTCWNEGFDTGVHNCKAYSPYQSDTNYSRIRSLSIYEMADELQVLIDEAVWSGEGKSNNELLEWLKSSAEEGE